MRGGEQRTERDQRAIAYVEAHGPSRSYEIGRAAKIPDGSISLYLGRLVERGELVRADGDGVIRYARPGQAPPRSEAQVPAPAPLPAREAPPPPPRPFAGVPAAGGDCGAVGVPIKELVYFMLDHGADWSAEETHGYVACVRQIRRVFTA